MISRLALKHQPKDIKLGTTFIDYKNKINEIINQFPIVGNFLELVNVPWVDVREYGAKGDGTTDDTSAFSSAIDAANGLTYGGVVWVPPGKFYLATQVYKTGITNVTILGCGDQSQIYLCNPTSQGGGASNPLHNGFLFSNSSGIKIKDLYFIGQWFYIPYDEGSQRCDSNGVYFYSKDGPVTDVEVSGCRFYNMQSGILVDGQETYPTSYIENYRILNNKVDTALYGIWSRVNAYWGIILGNIVRNISGMGIAVTQIPNNVTKGDETFSTVTGNLSEKSTGEAIIVCTNMVTVSGNICKDANVGIRIGESATSVHSVTVNGNIIRGNGTTILTPGQGSAYYTDYGIAINASSTRNTVIGNQIENIKIAGIVVSGFNNIISSNQINMATVNYNCGIQITPLSAAGIYANKVSGNEIVGSYYGINLGCLEATAQTTSYCTIENNQIYKATGGIALDSYAQYNYFKSNFFYNTTNGIYFNPEGGAWTNSIGNVFEDNRFDTGTLGIAGIGSLTTTKWAEFNRNVFKNYTTEASDINNDGLFLDRKWFYGNSTGALSSGTVVIYSKTGAFANCVLATTTQGDPLVAGVIDDAGSANTAEMIRIISEGFVKIVNVQGNVTLGNYLRTSTTSGRAEDAGAVITIGTFAIALTAYVGGAAGTVSAMLIPAIRH